MPLKCSGKETFLNYWVKNLYWAKTVQLYKQLLMLLFDKAFWCHCTMLLTICFSDLTGLLAWLMGNINSCWKLWLKAPLEQDCVTYIMLCKEGRPLAVILTTYYLRSIHRMKKSVKSCMSPSKFFKKSNEKCNISSRAEHSQGCDRQNLQVEDLVSHHCYSAYPLVIATDVKLQCFSFCKVNLPSLQIRRDYVVTLEFNH